MFPTISSALFYAFCTISFLAASTFWYNRPMKSLTIIRLFHHGIIIAQYVIVLLSNFDVERGALTDISPLYWQTDTAIGKHSWGYRKDNKYKSARQVICDLVDIVSKNGNLLINIGPRADGTITEEEEAELAAKSEQLISLKKDFDKQITDKNNEANDIGKKATSLGDNSKIKIATDYGETALEKGQPLAETEDLTKSFWRKLSGSWDKSGVRKAGNDLIDAGNNLLDKVNTTTNTNNLFTKKIK